MLLINVPSNGQMMIAKHNKNVAAYAHLEYLVFAHLISSITDINKAMTIKAKKAQSPKMNAGIMIAKPTIPEIRRVLKDFFVASDILLIVIV